MKLNLIVLYTSHPASLKSQYELLGLKFDYHKHGKGPYHYAANHHGLVFEIYPLTKSMEQADSNLRLGFDIDNLVKLMTDIRNSDWVVKTMPIETTWGEVAIIQDLDGRKVELKSV
ncbi:MAG: glyoxalase/bleomycin resistance/extradiol dioxygenase family protein [Roseivirga sp.]